MPSPSFTPIRPLLSILRQAVTDASDGPVATPELRAALDRMIRCAKPERRDEVEAITRRFWSAAATEMQGMRASWIGAVMRDVEGLFGEVAAE